MLAVDDSPLVRALVQEVLEEAGHTVLLAHNGREAWEIFESERSLDAVITDLDMPELDGRQLTQRIRAANDDIPILVLSGNQELEVAMELLRLGANDYVLKGEDLEITLLHALDTLLETHRLHRLNAQLADDLDQKNRQLRSFNSTLQSTVARLTRIGTSLMSEREIGSVLELIVSQARELTSAEGGTLYTLREGLLHFEIMQNPRLGVNMGGRSGTGITLAPIPLDPSNVSGCCALKRLPIRIDDLYASDDFDFSGPQEFDRERGYRTQSILVLPMLDRQGHVLGVLQLINAIDPATGALGVFSDDLVDLATSLAAQAAVSIENARAYATIEHKQVALERFVPVQFLEFLGRREIEDVQLGDATEQVLSVLFADIRSFTNISEGMSPAANFRFLNEYLHVISPLILGNGGFIDKYIGDAIMALFQGIGVGVADDALFAAMGMLEELDWYNEWTASKGGTPVHIGIGVNTGELTLGTIGYEGRMDTTVVGDTVNVAARLEGLTKHYDTSILATSATIERLIVPDRFLHRKVDVVQVKGREGAVGIWEIFNCDPDHEAKLATLDTFREAQAAFEAGRFREADARFAEVLSHSPRDQISRSYRERCAVALKACEPASWVTRRSAAEPT